MTKRQQEKLDAIFTRIAQEELQVETLEQRWSDTLDFYDIPVWELKKHSNEPTKKAEIQ